MKFDDVVEAIRKAIENLIKIISEFFAKFDVRPNYERESWTATYPYEDDTDAANA